MASPVTPVTAGPPFDASLDPNATLLLAHGVLSVIAFAVCIPLSFFFSRYFRTTELFQGHYWIATFGSAGLALVAFVLAFVYHNASQTAHFASAHSYFGLAVLFWLFVQQVSGAVLHYFYDERKEEYRDGRTAGIWVHVVSGFLCLCGGVASCGVGIWQWGNWYQSDPQLTYILIGSLIAFLLLFSGTVAVIGEFCVPRPKTTRFVGLTEAEANFRPPQQNGNMNGLGNVNVNRMASGGLDAQIARDRARAEMMMRSGY